MKNLSTTQDITVRVLTRKIGNVIGKPLQPLLEDGGNEFGVIEKPSPASGCR